MQTTKTLEGRTGHFSVPNIYRILAIYECPPSSVTVMRLEEESPLSYVLRSPYWRSMDYEEK